jgi:hypothetical protein
MMHRKHGSGQAFSIPYISMTYEFKFVYVVLFYVEHAVVFAC